jgi:glycosyltransferase involved in cell wall biosynthesis
MKVLLLSRYDKLSASTRQRFLQYLPLMEQQNIHTDVSSLFSDEYLLALYSGKSRWSLIFSAYWKRIKTLFKARSYDLIWIQMEIFPYVPAFAERLLRFLGVVYIVDYDDAIYHNYDKNPHWLIRALLGKKIDVIMRFSKMVIVGNEYLYGKAQSSGANRIELIPTVVNLNRYTAVQSTNNKPMVIGWIGSPSTSKYLLTISSIYKSLLSEFDVRFVAVGGNQETLKGLPIEVLPWSEETEVQLIKSFDIGIMPLTDSPWERGKCGYKLIQYMACGLPVVASPVGINKQIVENARNGLLAKEPYEWEQALRKLLNDKNLRQSMGKNGRERVEKIYSLQVQSVKLAKIIREHAEEKYLLQVQSIKLSKIIRKDKKNVLHIITGLNDGGAESVMSTMATSKSSNFKHIVISLMSTGKYGALLEEAGIETYYLNIARGKMSLFALGKIYKIIKKINPDVVQTWMPHCDLMGGIIARLAGIKNVYWSIHHSILVRGESKLSTILIVKLNSFLSKFIPTKIIYCADKSRETQEAIGFISSKGVIVNNGYDVSKFIYNNKFSSAFKNNLNISDKFLIGNVGSYNPQKDHKNLLLALKKLKAKINTRWHCILVGTNLDKSNSELTSLVLELGLTDNVSLIGPHNDIPVVMNAIDLFVLSSSSEAFPNVLNEAMACGTPCVTTNAGDSSFIVGNTGWSVPVRNPEALAESIIHAMNEKLSDKLTWEVRKNRARTRIVENFGIKKMIDKYEDIWSEGLKKIR